MKTQKLVVKGMHCPSCEMLIKEALMDIGASFVKADWKIGEVEVSGDIDMQKIRGAIKAEGYEVI